MQRARLSGSKWFHLMKDLAKIFKFFFTFLHLKKGELTPFLLDLIGPEQSAYVPGRSMTDSILLVQEAVHSMSRKRNL